ncbi:hypothetical protein WJX84_000813, partial [Apatococcus fuscideae]
RVVSIKTATLRVEQASLTGEPVAILKGVEAHADVECDLHDKDSMLFASTAVANGNCIGIVNSTGMTTEIGKIQKQIQDASEEEDDTPLKIKLDEFGEALARIIFWICVTVWVINYHHFLSWERAPGSILPAWGSVRFSLAKCTYYFKIAVALAVAAIPEGLPAVITTCLALGTRKMARRHAIVRKLPSVETLGCTTVICSDKTGTLTTNNMSVVKLVTLGSTSKDMQEWVVEENCALNNEAGIECRQGTYRAVGGNTEAALIVLAEKLGLADRAETRHCEDLRNQDPDTHHSGICNAYHSRVRTLATLEFDRNRKSMSTIVSAASPTSSSGADNMRLTRQAARQQSGMQLLVKGAAEFMLQRCSHMMLADGSVEAMDQATRGQLQASIDSMAGQALRCLAFAAKEDLGELNGYNGESHPGHRLLLDNKHYPDIESNMTWLGVAGLRDPPRAEVAGAIQECYQAGIRVMVITGDNKLTAEAICREIGIFSQDEDISSTSITSKHFSHMSKQQQMDFLQGGGGRCFSRAEPKHKQDLVRLLKEMGQVCAMTGDGVNDAPALKLADIGVAMGIAGTEVAKEASDMVLADDNFSTIVAAVEEGRAIYNNMKAFIRYMISSNIGEVASIFFTAALGLPEGLIPVQLLWVNLVTDGPPATALGFNPPDVDIMQKPPRDKNENLIYPWILFRWLCVGIYVGFATVGVFAAWYMFGSLLGVRLDGDGHTPITWYQLTHWEQCPQWKDFHPNPYMAGHRSFTFDNPCDYFTYGKAKASTLSLSVLVSIEMFNALNALSEDNSLLQMPPWSNPWLLLAGAISFISHFAILYIPPLADTFSIVPLSLAEWGLVLLFALPVIVIDEILKAVGRNFVNTTPTAGSAPRKLKQV